MASNVNHPFTKRHLSGDRHSFLTLIERAQNGKKRGWLVRCDCGTEKFVATSNLGITKSCGCMWKTLLSESRKTHGASITTEIALRKTYVAWCSMRWRCDNKNRRDYPLYGGRGIRYCDEWNSFESFLRDMGEKPDRASLDRIDNEGNYSKSNCRWATNKEQANNKRSNLKIFAFGQTRNLNEWAEIYSIKRSTLSYRIKIGWSAERAMMTPLKRQKNNRAHRVGGELKRQGHPVRSELIPVKSVRGVKYVARYSMEK